MDVKGAISDISGATVTGNCIHLFKKKKQTFPQMFVERHLFTYMKQYLKYSFALKLAFDFEIWKENQGLETQQVNRKCCSTEHKTST